MASDALLNLVLLKARLVYLWKQRHRERIRANAIDSIRRRLEEARHLGLRNFECICNVALFVVLADEDVSTFSRDIFLASSDRRRRFSARHLAVLLYELSQDIPRLIGRDFRAAFGAIDAPTDWIDELNAVSSGVNIFKKNHSEFLEGIRNTVAAHRDKVAIEQLKVLDAVDSLQVLRLSGELSHHLGRFVALQVKVIAHAGALRQSGREIARSQGGV